MLVSSEQTNAMLDELAADGTMINTFRTVVAELVTTEQSCVNDVGAADATGTAWSGGWRTVTAVLLCWVLLSCGEERRTKAKKYT